MTFGLQKVFPLALMCDVTFFCVITGRARVTLSKKITFHREIESKRRSTLPIVILLYAEKKNKKGSEVANMSFAPYPVPHEISSIWSTTNNDRLMMQIVRSQRKIKERIDKHEEILKEILCYLSHEGNICPSRKGIPKSIENGIEKTGEISRQSLEKIRY